jgi:hypothetical protein
LLCGAVLRPNGAVVAWGLEARDVHVNIRARSLSAGAFFLMALRSNGTVAAWGDDFDHDTDVPSGLRPVTGQAAGR